MIEADEVWGQTEQGRLFPVTEEIHKKIFSHMQIHIGKYSFMNEITQCKTRVNNIIKVVMNVKYVNDAMTVCILLYGWKEIFSSKKSASSIKDSSNVFLLLLQIHTSTGWPILIYHTLQRCR
jgi:hypothetical protein